MAAPDLGIPASAMSPKSATVDGDTATAHPLPDVIAAERYAASKAAMAAGGPFLRRQRQIPPGATGVECCGHPFNQTPCCR